MKTERSFSIPCLYLKKQGASRLWKGGLKKSGNLRTGKNSDFQGISYETYWLSKKEWLSFGGQGVLYVGILSYVFYRKFLVFLALIPVGICYPLIIQGDLKRKRLEQLRGQFKDAILSVASCLNAGYSVEHAFAEALKDMDRIYGAESMISEEIRLMIHKTKVNRTFEEALMDFAKRSTLEDVRSFADVFLSARVHGGELMRIIARTAEIIGEKIRIQEDILTATASRRLEQKIMSMVPILIVCYLDLTSPGFFDVLYTTIAGRMIMTCCLMVYLGSMYLGKRMVECSV